MKNIMLFIINKEKINLTLTWGQALLTFLALNHRVPYFWVALIFWALFVTFRPSAENIPHALML